MSEKLWQIVQRRDGDPGVGVREDAPRATMSRRTFVELIGFSIGALAISGCRPPEQKIVPFLRQPVELTPGVANWYASICNGCGTSCGVLVKVRDGRPIKLEGNPDHPLSRGGICAVANAQAFSLYDADRLRHPLIGSKEAAWEQVDEQITRKLDAIKESGGTVRVVTPTITSPTSREVIQKFLSQFADGRHIVYDAYSCAAIREAHSRTHNIANIPLYRFDRAKLVVNFGADFLGGWISPSEYARGYAEARDLRGGWQAMLKHVQFEQRMSLTGSNADERIKVSPAEEIQALLLLAKLVTRKSTTPRTAESSSFDTSQLSPRISEAVERAAEGLLESEGNSIVLSGSNDVDVQTVVNFINQATGSYGKTLDLDPWSEQRQSSDRDMVEMVRQMNEGRIAAVIISGVNPVYDYYAPGEFITGLNKVPLKISLNPYRDETSVLADYTCPQHHFLEAWDDATPARGIFSLAQPTIAPLFKTRQYQDSLMRWSGDTRSFYVALRDWWKDRLFPLQSKYATFNSFWDNSLRDGAVMVDKQPPQQVAFVPDSIGQSIERLRVNSSRIGDGLTLVLYEKVSMRDGRHANNPWLQELPDPLTKITWENYACVSPELARGLGLEEGSLARVSKNGLGIEIPVHIQPGHQDSTIAIAIGYGREKAGKVGNGVGVNAFPLVEFADGSFKYTSDGVKVEKLSGKVEFASTQRHNTMDGRPIVRELTLEDYLQGAKEEASHESRSIWTDHAYGEHKWGMVVDLSACIGCSACILSCQAENNVPVVGKDEVRRQREMHWIRLDRYYSGSEEDPHVVYQPVMCSQCDNASCESVCPVLATVHSSDGLNMQVYNRCVGTRYCANNCPYKVRRFNWFEYPHDDPLANMALNPDVTVRTRGVMEKCTFCVQRIQEVKIKARNEGRDIRDGEIQPACVQSCPAGAIVFGDLVKEDSQVARLKHEERDYILLEELNLRPAVSYLAKVRNSSEET